MKVPVTIGGVAAKVMALSVTEHISGERQSYSFSPVGKLLATWVRRDSGDERKGRSHLLFNNSDCQSHKFTYAKSSDLCHQEELCQL